jgi:hypothetical protein
VYLRVIDHPDARVLAARGALSAKAAEVALPRTAAVPVAR